MILHSGVEHHGQKIVTGSAYYSRFSFTNNNEADDKLLTLSLIFSGLSKSESFATNHLFYTGR
jgi:hypothetical protein